MKEKDTVKQTLSHLFRQESGKMVAVLAKIFGVENLELIEDVVQDALVKALETWKYKGIPENPQAWLYRTAKNKAIDIIRRNKHSQIIDFSSPHRKLLVSEYTLVNTIEDFWKEKQIKDDFLGMMYACCHPDISQEQQITFILKSLCGFSTKEVAKSFLCSEDTISKRLYRTKKYFREHKIFPKIPENDEIVLRTKTVLNAIYLMFNEGYSATHTDQLIRKDVVDQALFLCNSLLLEQRTQLPEVYALMALMCFHTSRMDSRITREGTLVLLEHQNRTNWDAKMIHLGAENLNKAAFGNTITTYHLEAAIAYQHCCAQQYEDTDWKKILEYYDLLLNIDYDPIVFLNRCLVILKLKGAEEALYALNKIKENSLLNKYYLYHAILGEIYKELNQNHEAILSYKNAIKLTQSKQEKLLFESKVNLVLDKIG